MEYKDFIAEEDALEAEIVRQLKVGGSEEYNNSISLFPIGKIQSPVRIPSWMFRKFKHHPVLELDDIERVALAHVIHYFSGYSVWLYRVQWRYRELVQVLCRGCSQCTSKTCE